MADDGGLGMMPPATALTAVSLIGGTVNDIVNVAALGPTVALPQGLLEHRCWSLLPYCRHQ